ncbi:uncharacterized protein BXIN_1468 [Babesia sp. Xinjiang]|uniref:uncharacterized protein n=1 Tax=Babesia sp. Xinjiang TaxID=462227 RepID=UPI000A227913|nr:uncharacterized protein BXIN_1468 [Babesia sp. Xinjiang]ORM40035.1 hypothetical protein BXIN_1468 [Babesia sp. Xinjiang]
MRFGQKALATFFFLTWIAITANSLWYCVTLKWAFDYQNRCLNNDRTGFCSAPDTSKPSTTKASSQKSSLDTSKSPQAKKVEAPPSKLATHSQNAGYTSSVPKASSPGSISQTKEVEKQISKPSDALQPSGASSGKDSQSLPAAKKASKDEPGSGLSPQDRSKSAVSSPESSPKGADAKSWFPPVVRSTTADFPPKDPESRSSGSPSEKVTPAIKPSEKKPGLDEISPGGKGPSLGSKPDSMSTKTEVVPQSTPAAKSTPVLEPTPASEPAPVLEPTTEPSPVPSPSHVEKSPAVATKAAKTKTKKRQEGIKKLYNVKPMGFDESWQ